MAEETTKFRLPTLATMASGRRQRIIAFGVCLGATLVTAFLMPVAAYAMAPMPGFIPTYQTALITVYALTTYLLLAQYRRTRSVSLLLLSLGGLYTAMIVFVQLLSFPNIFATGRLLGSGPETTAWLWMFWHIGPPLFALPYAFLEGGAARFVAPALADRVGWLAAAVTLVGVVLVAVLTARFAYLLPKSIEGDDYRLFLTNGVGQGVIALTILAFGAVVWTTGLRSVLQLWLAASLYLLVLDNMVTLAGGARGSIGWFSGRLEALAAAIILLSVYLREVDFLYGRAEKAAEESESQRADLELARDRLAIALDAAGMAEWELNVAEDQWRRSVKHDQMFGYDTLLPHWGRRAFLDHVVAEDREMVEAAFARAGDAGRLEFECRVIRAGETVPRWIMVRGNAYCEKPGQVTTMAGVVMDTTMRRILEERSNQAQKMAAIGQLTGGVAHDFNNLLTVIIGNLDMITRFSANTQRVEKLARSAMTAANRGADVVHNLLAFSRQQILHPETVNPNRVLKSFVPLLRRAVGETCKIDVDFDAALDPVRLDAGQFESAVLNLMVNARDAMPNGGTITLSTQNIAFSAADLTDLPELPPGDYVMASVSDSGFGMDASTKARVLEPFFTTKEVGKGTGLGLSQAYGFVRQAGGQIRITSAPGIGTRVDLILPRSEERVEVARSGKAMSLRRAMEGEVILVVEDEPSVLDMAVESLAELGYVTLTAHDAAAALERLRGDDRIDILFSDVMMPGGMNGVQLAVQARHIRPNLRVLLTSGYTGGGVDEHEMPLLNKPYKREELAVKLRLVMEG